MNLPSYQNCVLDMRFWLGSFMDFSGNGNHGTPTGTHFQKRPDKVLVYGDETTNTVTVTDSPELRITQGTAVFYTDSFKQATGTLDILSNKASNHPSVYLATQAERIDVYDGASTRTLSNFYYPGKTFIAVTFADGETPKAYLEGEYIDELSGTIVCDGTSTSNLLIGNQSGGRSLSSGLKGHILYDVKLTDAQIAELYLWTKGTTTPSYKKKNFYAPPQIDGREEGLIASWAMDNIGQKAIDKKGNHGDIVTCYASKTNAGQKALEMNAMGYINVPHNDVFNYLGEQSIAFIFRTYGTGSIFDKASGGPPFISQSTGRIIWGESGAYVYTTSAFDDGIVHHCVCTYDGTTGYDSLKIYVDGWLQPQTGVGAFDGFSTSGNAIKLGSRFTGGSSLDGALVDSLSWYNREFTQSEVSNLYNEFATLPIYVDCLVDTNESVSTQSGAGNFVENSSWQIVSGSFKISRSETVSPGKKVIECVSNGALIKKGFTSADQSYTKTFEAVSGNPTLTKNSTYLQLDMLAGEKVGDIEIYQKLPYSTPLVYVLAGQSNAIGRAPVAGMDPANINVPTNVEYWEYGTRKYVTNGGTWFGPEASFMQDISAAHPERRIIVVKQAVSGSDCYAAWQKVWDADKALVNSQSTHAYPLLSADIEDIVSSRGLQIDCLLWMQGETDASSSISGDAYSDSLDSMVSDLNADFGQISKIVVGRVLDVGVAATAVRAAQWDVTNTSPGGVTSAVIDTDDLNTIDGVHYDAAGLETLGSRFASNT